MSIITDICLSGEENLERVPLTQFFPKRTYGLFLRKGKVLSPAAREFIQYIDPHAVEMFRTEENRKGKKYRT